MDIRKKQRAVVDALEDIKGRDIVVYNVERLSPIFERVVIASGDSTRQVKALADHVARTLKTLGASVKGVEGQGSAEWMLVDLGDIVVHVMHPTVRSYYNLEEIWGGKEVRLKSTAPAPARRGASASAAARPAALPERRRTAKPAAKRKAKKASPAKRAKAARRGGRG